MEQKMKLYGTPKIVIVSLNIDDAIRTSSQTRGDIFTKTGADIWKTVVDDTEFGA